MDQTRQVDVFGLVESLGLWLAFFPLDGLLGAYLPEGAGGILITTERSTPIQRYTAAHELGHWRLDGGHDAALDTESDVLGRTDIERETLAQVFAGALLMPPPLVHSILSRRNATSLGQSIWLGTANSSMSGPMTRSLFRCPKTAVPATDGRSQTSVRVQDVPRHCRLPRSPTTYPQTRRTRRWLNQSRRLARLGASESRDAVQHVRNEKIVAGAMGRRVFGIQLREPGKTQLRLVLRNEYGDADPVDEYRITAAVEARPPESSRTRR